MFDIIETLPTNVVKYVHTYRKLHRITHTHTKHQFIKQNTPTKKQITPSTFTFFENTYFQQIDIQMLSFMALSIFA